jgi:CheY-like chemotaxis protein
MSQALLLAEAEPATREFLARHLASDGFAVLGADAGREALELVERERPDLVLVGGLPDAPALEVCRVLREGEPGRSWDRDVPVIVLGEARADAVDRVHAFERGCDDFVPRPFHYEELVARIHAVLRRTQLATRPTRVFTKEELLRDVGGFRSLRSKRHWYPRSGGTLRAPMLTTRTQPRVGTAAGRLE